MKSCNMQQLFSVEIMHYFYQVKADKCQSGIKTAIYCMLQVLICTRTLMFRTDEEPCYVIST